MPLLPGNENFDETRLQKPSYIYPDKTISLLKEMISMQIGDLNGIYKESVNKKIETFFLSVRKISTHIIFRNLFFILRTDMAQ